MTRVWFRGASWCPRDEQCVLLLSDTDDRPVLRFQVSPQQRYMVLDEIARAHGGCCSSHCLLRHLLDSLQLEVEAVVFERADGSGRSRIDLRGQSSSLQLHSDPLDALVFAVSLGAAMYVDTSSHPTPVEKLDKAQRDQGALDALPQAFSQWFQGSEAFKHLDDHDKGTGLP